MPSLPMVTAEPTESASDAHSGLICIRKYPNRRLYDTSRSRHLTHDGVLALIADGRTVQVTDSRTGTDITNAVLLQIMIERDPSRLRAIPSALVHRAMRCDMTALNPIATRALEAWRGARDTVPANYPVGPVVLGSDGGT